MTELKDKERTTSMNRRFMIGAIAVFCIALVLGYSNDIVVLSLKIALMILFVVFVYLAFGNARTHIAMMAARASLATSLAVIFFVWTLGYQFLPKGSSIDLCVQLVGGGVALTAYCLILTLKA